MAAIMGMIDIGVLLVSGVVSASTGIMLFIWAIGGDVKDNPQGLALTFIICLVIAALSGSNLVALYIADHK